MLKLLKDHLFKLLINAKLSVMEQQHAMDLVSWKEAQRDIAQFILMNYWKEIILVKEECVSILTKRLNGLIRHSKFQLWKKNQKIQQSKLQLVK